MAVPTTTTSPPVQATSYASNSCLWKWPAGRWRVFTPGPLQSKVRAENSMTMVAYLIAAYLIAAAAMSWAGMVLIGLGAFFFVTLAAFAAAVPAA